MTGYMFSNIIKGLPDGAFFCFAIGAIITIDCIVMVFVERFREKRDGRKKDRRKH